MTGHPDSDALAEYRDGLAGRRRSARIRAHLTGCPRCAALDRDLAEVSTLLASAPVPPMPGQLAARLEGVLAAEVAARSGRAEGHAAGQPDHDATGQRSRKHPARPRRWQVPSLRAATATAVAVLVVAGGGFGLTRLLQHGTGPASSASSASSASGPATSPEGTAAGPRQPASKPNAAAGGELSPASIPLVRSGTDYRAAELAAQVTAVLSLHPAGVTAPANDILGLERQHPHLQGCVRLITGGTRPRLVDLASYQGRPATIIVQAGAGSQAAQVWVAGPGCSAASRDVIAHAQLPGGG